MHTLSYLDGYSLINCQKVSHSICSSGTHRERTTQVCRTFLTIIEQDLELRYIVELYKAGMIDEPRLFPTLSPHDRLGKLRDFLAERRSQVQKKLGQQDAIITYTEGAGVKQTYNSDLIARLHSFSNRLGMIELTDNIGKSADSIIVREASQHDVPPGEWGTGEFRIDRDQDLMIALDGK